MNNLNSILSKEHEILESALNDFLADRIDAAELKKFTAKHGIYQQNNGLFMVRIRIPGGEINAGNLKKIAEIISQNQMGYAHLTTRQDIQLHDVEPEKIFPAVRMCTGSGMPFRGGGGDTFRNIMVNPGSGVNANSIFDVYPYVQALNQFMFTYDNAFGLPRKLKIGFFSDPGTDSMAAIQDLGFVAQRQKGQDGFTVFAAGGLGRVSGIGVKLFDFLPAGELLRCAVAVTELFNDNGNRENRGKARLRFVLEKLGEKAFVDIFKEYYSHTSKIIPELKSTEPGVSFSVPDKLPEVNVDSAGFAAWKATATNPAPQAGKNFFSVRIFIPDGNLQPVQLEMLAELPEKVKCPVLRLTAFQDIILPGVHESALPWIYESLPAGFRLESLKGLLNCCIGADVCKIGILPSPKIAAAVTEKLDKIFTEQPEHKSLAPEIINTIAISGCPNSCSRHTVAALGFMGMKKTIDGERTDCCQVFLNGRLGSKSPKLADTSKDLILPANKLPGLIGKLTRDFISSENPTDFSGFLANYSIQKIDEIIAGLD